MKLRNFLLPLALMMMSSNANAIGVTTTSISVPDSRLGGYVATLPAGWTSQNFYFGVATSSSVPASSQQFFAINYTRANSTPITLPPAVKITRLSGTGAVLSVDALPIQVVSADCTLPVYNAGTTSYNGCPSITGSAYALKALAGRLVIYEIKQTYSTQTKRYNSNIWVYIFDPAGAVGSTDRWKLVSYLQDLNFNTVGAFTNADTLAYSFSRPTATSTAITSIVAK